MSHLCHALGLSKCLAIRLLVSVGSQRLHFWIFIDSGGEEEGIVAVDHHYQFEVEQVVVCELCVDDFLVQ